MLFKWHKKSTNNVDNNGNINIRNSVMSILKPIMALLENSLKFSLKTTIKIGFVPVLMYGLFCLVFYLRDILIFTDNDLNLLLPSLGYLFSKFIIPVSIFVSLLYFLVFLLLYKRVESMNSLLLKPTTDDRLAMNKLIKLVLKLVIFGVYASVLLYSYVDRLVLNLDRLTMYNLYYCVWLIFLIILCASVQYQIAFLEFTKAMPFIGLYTLDKQKTGSIRWPFIRFTIYLVGIAYGSILLNNEVMESSLQTYVYNQRSIALRQATIPEINRYYRDTEAQIMRKELSRAKIPIYSFVDFNQVINNVDRHFFLLNFLPILLILLIVGWLEYQRSCTLDYNIANISQSIRKIVRGESSLKDRLNISNFDSFGYMAGYINLLLNLLMQMVGGVRELTTGLRDSSIQIEKSSLEGTNSMQSLIESLNGIVYDVEQQNSELELSKGYLNELTTTITTINKALGSQMILLAQTSGTTEQFSNSVSHVREISLDAEKLTQELISVADTGTDAVEAAVKAINRISDASSNMSRAMGVITKIATQTNLLSMNAAIESAHAGTIGKGFAVVANEVRGLSETSTKQSRAIRDEISVMNERIEEGLSVSNNVQNNLKRIINGIEKSRRTVSQVASSMEEQANGVEDILKSISLINDSSSQISKQTEAQKQQADSLLESLQNLIELSKQILDETGVQLKEAKDVSTLVSSIEQISKDNLRKVEALNDAVTKFTL